MYCHPRPLPQVCCGYAYQSQIPPCYSRKCFSAFSHNGINLYCSSGCKNSKRVVGGGSRLQRIINMKRTPVTENQKKEKNSGCSQPFKLYDYKYSVLCQTKRKKTERNCSSSQPPESKCRRVQVKASSHHTNRRWQTVRWVLSEPVFADWTCWICFEFSQKPWPSLADK